MKTNLVVLLLLSLFVSPFIGAQSLPYLSSLQGVDVVEMRVSTQIGDNPVGYFKRKIAKKVPFVLLSNEGKYTTDGGDHSIVVAVAKENSQKLIDNGKKVKSRLDIKLGQKTILIKPQVDRINTATQLSRASTQGIYNNQNELRKLSQVRKAPKGKVSQVSKAKSQTQNRNRPRAAKRTRVRTSHH